VITGDLDMKKLGKVVLISFITSIFLVGCAQKSDALVLSGTIETTEVDVNAEISGKIIKILKEEGSSLSEGDALAQVAADGAALQIKSAEATLKATKAKLDELKAGSRIEEIKQAEAAVETAKANLDGLKAGNRSELIAQAEATYFSAQEGTATAQKNYDYHIQNLKKFQILLENEAISEQTIEDAKNLSDTAYQQLINAKTQMQVAKEQLNLLKNGATNEAIRAAEANYKGAQARLDLLKEGATDQAILQAEASVEQSQAALDTAKLQLEKYTIKAPVQGILLYKNVEQGQVVSPGSVIGIVQSKDNYWIKVYLPQKYNGRIALNQKVVVTASALEGENIGGTVIFKSPKAEFTPKNIETTQAKEENTVIELKIRIDSHINKLSPGMTANVMID
jgi:HlyD family secretion protein